MTLAVSAVPHGPPADCNACSILESLAPLMLHPLGITTGGPVSTGGVRKGSACEARVCHFPLAVWATNPSHSRSTS